MVNILGHTFCKALMHDIFLFILHFLKISLLNQRVHLGLAQQDQDNHMETKSQGQFHLLS